VCGHRDRPDQLAQQLFGALRRFDEAGVDIIFAEGCPNVGIGHAVMNRLRKAAGHQVIEV
jgi:L-threonylcarbamoyladenylate synthase